jgi:hypothetical protein
MQCYEKNQYWAACLDSCTQGVNARDAEDMQTPWTCRKIGQRTLSGHHGENRTMDADEDDADKESKTQAANETGDKVEEESMGKGANDEDETTCDDYENTTGCGWTLKWHCPGQPDGIYEAARNDGTPGYDCCCGQQRWRKLPGMPQKSDQDAIPEASSQSPQCSRTMHDDCRDTHCCRDPGMQCYQKHQWWGACLESCTPGMPVDGDDGSPWDCWKLGSRTPGASENSTADNSSGEADDESTSRSACSGTLDYDCRSTLCCSEPGMQCFEKNEWWAACKPSCTPGIDTHDPVDLRTWWSCKPLDHAKETSVILERDDSSVGGIPVEAAKQTSFLGAAASVILAASALALSSRLLRSGPEARLRCGRPTPRQGLVQVASSSQPLVADP